MNPLNTKANITDALIHQLHMMEYKNASTKSMYHKILQHHGQIIITRIIDEFDYLLSRSTYYFMRLKSKLLSQRLNTSEYKYIFKKNFIRNQYHFCCNKHIHQAVNDKINHLVLDYLITNRSDYISPPDYRKLYHTLNTSDVLSQLTHYIHFPISHVTEQQVRNILKCLHSTKTQNIITHKSYFHYKPSNKTNALVKRQFIQSHPNDVWCSDTVQITINKIKYYICFIIDLYDHIILSSSISKKEDANLVISALKKIINQRDVYNIAFDENSLIFHSDNGSLYNCNTFISFCDSFLIKQSRSRPGTPNDNGVIEGINSLFKNHISHTSIPITSESCLQNQLDLFESYYNNRIQKMCVAKSSSNARTYTYDSPISHRKKYYQYHNYPTYLLHSHGVTNY